MGSLNAPADEPDEQADNDNAQQVAMYVRKVRQYTNGGLELREAEELANLEARDTSGRADDKDKKRIKELRAKLLENARKRRRGGRQD